MKHMTFSFITNRQYREAKILNWISLGLLFFVTAFIWAPSRDAVVAVYAIAWFIPLLMVLVSRKPSWQDYGGRLTLWALLFAAYTAVTCLWARQNQLGLFVLNWFLLASWLVGICWFASQRAIAFSRLYESLMYLGVVVGLLLLTLFYYQQPWNVRLASELLASNSNELGALFGILSLLAYYHWIKSDSTRDSFRYGLLLIVLILPLVLSQSRSALFAFLVTTCLAFFYVRPSRYKFFFHFVLMVLFLIIAFVFVDQWKALLSDRLGLGLRDVVWSEVFARAMNGNFWLGVGVDTKSTIDVPHLPPFHHAHNIWLDTFYRTGFIGLCLFITHTLSLILQFRPNHTLVPLYLWLLFGLLSGLFDYRIPVWGLDFKWFLYWIPAGLIAAAHIQLRSASEYEAKGKIYE